MKEGLQVGAILCLMFFAYVWAVYKLPHGEKQKELKGAAIAALIIGGILLLASYMVK